MSGWAERYALGRQMVFPAFVLVVLASLGAGVIADERKERKNVLFISIDDLRPALGCYGDPVAITPNIDRLAKRGTVFRRAYCQEAVCAPSRLSLLTGRRPDTIEVWDLKTHFREAIPDVVTLPQHFKEAGYLTRSIGKIYHGSGEPSQDPPSWSVDPVYDANRDPELRYALESNLKGKGLKRNASESAPVEDDHYIDGLIAKEAVEALRELGDSKEPFFLAVGFKKPHLPFCAPEKYWDLYDRDEIPAPEPSHHPEGAPELAWRSWEELEGYRDIDDDGVLTESQVKELRHGYYACVSYIDAQVGRLLDQLESSGLSGNTIICLWGDHGFHLGEQGIWTKANNYELSTRVPLIVADPSQDSGGDVTNALVELVDVYPTLVDLSGLSIPYGLEGISFAPLMKDPERTWKTAAFSQYPRAKTGNRHEGRGDLMGYAVRTDRYRYVEWQDSRSGEVVAQELYDQDEDPGEAFNRASDPELAQALEEHRKIMEEGWQSVLPSDQGIEAANRPNVLFLAVDDMKDWVNCLGGYEGTVHTPHIDRLAARGTLFANAHCPSPKCAPSRIAVMTGLMPSTTGLYDNSHWWYPNDPDMLTIPVHFMRHGYRVVGAGKIFHHTAGNHPADQWHDFQKLLFRDDPWFRSVKLNYPWSDDGPYPENFPFSGVVGLGHENDWGSLGYEEADYDDTRTADYAVSFLEGSFEQPFFLACGLFRPHLPWYVPQKYFDLYPLEEVVLPPVKENDVNDLPIAGKAFAEARRKDWEKIRGAGKWREAVQAYLASISYADAQLGRVLDALDASEAVGNTVVVLWSDHGWHLGEKDHWHKTTLWEEATRVPFVISAPGFDPGVSNRSVSLIDLFPTLNELCDLPPLDRQDGESLVPLLQDPEAPCERPAIVEYKEGNVAVRSDRFRYIRYADGSEEFYDLISDPHEWKNRAEDGDLAEVKLELRKWATTEWAKSAKTKSAYDFDPVTFSWKEKTSGHVIRVASETASGN
ncbi:MAG: sulfatase [Verrucomicrobiota bacterium]